MVDAHASGACEATHGGSSPFIGKYLIKTTGRTLHPGCFFWNNGGLPDGILPRKTHKFANDANRVLSFLFKHKINY